MFAERGEQRIARALGGGPCVLSELLDKAVELVADVVTLVVVDTDESNVFSSVSPGIGYPERLERTSSMGAVFGVESDEATKSSNLLRDLMLEALDIAVGPLSWSLLDYHGGYCLDPIPVGFKDIVSKA